MSLRTGHGTGAGQPRIEVLPPDELPDPVPADSSQPSVALTFRPDGKIADKATAAELGRRGGAAKARKVRFLTALGLEKLDVDHAFAAYRRSADEFAAHHLERLAMLAGGSVGSGPSTIVGTAALQLAASRYLSDQAQKTCDATLFITASRLGNESRQNILAAYELAVREAQVTRGPKDPLAEFMIPAVPTKP